METEKIEEKKNGQAGPVRIKSSRLKAKDPKAAEPRKPVLVVFGKAGVGKTWTSIDFPAVYYIDTEGGASRGHYTDKLKKSGGAYLGPEDGATDPNEIITQVDALASEQHEFKTLVIDSITKVFNNLIATEAERLGDKDAFGASKKPAIAWMRRLILHIASLDMNVILIAHQKDEWSDQKKVGETLDAWEKLAYELDLTLQINKTGKTRTAKIYKTRLAEFPEGESFPWNYEEFAARYGREVIERAHIPLVIASAEQLTTIKTLLEVVKIPEEEIAKWFSKAQVESWERMPSETINKCINYLKAKVG